MNESNQDSPFNYSFDRPIGFHSDRHFFKQYGCSFLAIYLKYQWLKNSGNDFAHVKFLYLARDRFHVLNYLRQVNLKKNLTYLDGAFDSCWALKKAQN